MYRKIDGKRLGKDSQHPVDRCHVSVAHQLRNVQTSLLDKGWGELHEPQDVVQGRVNRPLTLNQKH